MRVELHPAYLLHKRRYRESSLLLEVLSSVYGRVGLIARGALGGRGPLGAVLEPFRPLYVGWSGRSELATLTRAETAGKPLPLNGRELFSGFYINEVMMRAVARDDPNVALYQAYERALTALASGSCAEAVLRQFEKSLLDAIGYAMNLTEEVDSVNRVRPDQSYCYYVGRGPARSAEGGRHVPVRGATLLALAGEHPFDESLLREAKTLMRFVLKHYIGDRPLAARALFTKSRTATV
jgi:DNA repair protein RecO (recombination protein O)